MQSIILAKGMSRIKRNSKRKHPPNKMILRSVKTRIKVKLTLHVKYKKARPLIATNIPISEKRENRND